MKNEIHERIIWNKILVHSAGEHEQKVKWYFYLKGELKFPFFAQMPIKLKDSLGGELFKEVKVVGLLSNDAHLRRHRDMIIEGELDQYILKFRLSELENIRALPRVKAAIELWKYWIVSHDREYAKVKDAL